MSVSRRGRSSLQMRLPLALWNYCCTSTKHPLITAGDVMLEYIHSKARLERMSNGSTTTESGEPALRLEMAKKETQVVSRKPLGHWHISAPSRKVPPTIADTGYQPPANASESKSGQVRSSSLSSRGPAVGNTANVQTTGTRNVRPEVPLC